MKLELLIPTSLSEIPLKHYQEFRNVAENSNEYQSLIRVGKAYEYGFEKRET